MSRDRVRTPSRRAVMIGGAALGAGLAIAARPSDEGGGHAPYFVRLAAALRRAGIARPVMVIDRDRLDANIAAARTALAPSALPLRVVVKSLPAPALIARIAAGMGTRRMMVFNGPMLAQVGALDPGYDFLLGKPLPVAEVAALLATVPAATIAQAIFLVDTPARLAQLGALARERRTPLSIGYEIDVGLHRGGFADPPALAAALRQTLAVPELKPAALMGYDPHVAKLPFPERVYTASQARFAAFVAAAQATLGPAARTLVRNGAGSPTYARHARGTVAGEVSVGSAFVKPGDFDQPWLEPHVPAAFIATPVLKATARVDVPGLEWATDVLRLADPNRARGFFIQGGHWLAAPVSPPGLRYNTLFGRSSNQELLTGSASVRLAPDDTVFLRPDQSEAVLLQFGDLVIYAQGEIVDRWPTLPVSA